MKLVERITARFRLRVGVVGQGVELLMGGLKFRNLKTGDKVLTVVGVPGRSGSKGHEGHKFFVYIKGYGDSRIYTLTPATSKGVPGFMESDEQRKFRSGEVTFLMPR